MNNFFIVSLPRSRTAWLANYLTCGDSFCFHEGLMGCDSIKALKGKMEATRFPIVGNSDCGNILFLEEIMDEFPEAKFVFIHRSPSEVEEELSRIGLPDNGLVAIEASRMNSYDSIGLHVEYEDLKNKSFCAEIYTYCTDQPFNQDRWEMLDKLDILIFVDRKIEEVQNHMNEAINLFQGGTISPGQP